MFTKSSRIRDKHNNQITLGLELEDEIIQQNNSSNNNPTIEQNINTIPVNDLKETYNLSASSEKLSVSHQELPKLHTLKKNTKGQFQF